jgi:hypothetical protein
LNVVSTERTPRKLWNWKLESKKVFIGYELDGIEQLKLNSCGISRLFEAKRW